MCDARPGNEEEDVDCYIATFSEGEDSTRCHDAEGVDQEVIM
jgi:hypothetical protein